MSKIRIGIVGCGNIAEEKHVPTYAIGYRDRAVITALCDIKPERTEYLAKKYELDDVKHYTDYRDLVNDPNVDVVHVCTPNVSHCEIACAAFAAGKHVYCEKPMAGSIADAQKMMDAWKASGKKYTIGLQNRYREEITVLHSLQQAGEFGKIYFAKARGICRRRIPAYGVYISKKDQGGGALIDYGPHCIDVALYLMDNYKPVSVSGQIFDYIGKGTEPKDQGNLLECWDNTTFDVEDSAIGMVKFEDGAVLNVEVGWAMNVNQWDYAQATIAGTKAGASMEDGAGMGKPYRVFKYGVLGGKLADTELKCSVPYNSVPLDLTSKIPYGIPAYLNFGNWLDAIEDKAEILVKPEEAFVMTQIIEGIYTSAKTGKEFYF